MAACTSVRRCMDAIDISEAVNHRASAFLAPGRHDRSTSRQAGSSLFLFGDGQRVHPTPTGDKRPVKKSPPRSRATMAESSGPCSTIPAALRTTPVMTCPHKGCGVPMIMCFSRLAVGSGRFVTHTQSQHVDYHCWRPHREVLSVLRLERVRKHGVERGTFWAACMSAATVHPSPAERGWTGVTAPHFQSTHTRARLS